MLWECPKWQGQPGDVAPAQTGRGLPPFGTGHAHSLSGVPAGHESPASRHLFPKRIRTKLLYRHVQHVLGSIGNANGSQRGQIVTISPDHSTSSLAQEHLRP